MTAMDEAGLNIEDLVRHEIGELGARIRRIKDKAVRADVARWLGEQGKTCPPEVRLRAYLAIGRTPEPGLVTGPILRRALSVGDCASFASLLTMRRVLLDADTVFSTLAALVSTDRKFRVERLAGTLARTVARWHARRNRIPLDSSTIRAYAEVVLALLEKARESSPPARSKRDELLLKLVAIAILEGAEVSASAVQWEIFRLLTVAQNVIEPELAHALDEQQGLRSALDSVVSKTIEQTRKMALSGKTEELENSARNLLRSTFTKRQAERLLKDLYSDRGELDAGVQRAIAHLLGIDHETQPQPDFETGTAPSVQSTQLASALMRSWAAAGDSRHAKEAFDELCSVVGNFFGIQLKGEPGEIVEFNPLAHELAQIRGEKPSRVRVIRPRVEMSGPVTNVLIKALVEPA